MGGRLTYTIQVQNLGPGDATAVVVTDPLSASDADFVSATATSGTCEHKANTVTCSLGQINAGAAATVTIVVEPKKAGTLSNTATVTSPEDNTPSTATATTVVKKGKGGRDRLRGNAGNDLLGGGKKRDNCKGGAGRDILKSCP